MRKQPIRIWVDYQSETLKATMALTTVYTDYHIYTIKWPIITGGKIKTFHDKNRTKIFMPLSSTEDTWRDTSDQGENKSIDEATERMSRTRSIVKQEKKGGKKTLWDQQDGRNQNTDGLNSPIPKAQASILNQKAKIVYLLPPRDVPPLKRQPAPAVKGGGTYSQANELWKQAGITRLISQFSIVFR